MAVVVHLVETEVQLEVQTLAKVAMAALNIMDVLF
jgi:hypothetical protein